MSTDQERRLIEEALRKLEGEDREARAHSRRLAAYLAFDAEVDREQERVRDELRSYGLFVQ